MNKTKKTRNGHKNSPIYKKRARLWKEALIKNEKKAHERMYDKEGGRCCLAVAQDVAKERSKVVRDALKRKSDEKEERNYLPIEETCKYFGWSEQSSPLLGFKSLDAVILNDGMTTLGEKPRTHKEIAGFVAREWGV